MTYQKGFTLIETLLYLALFGVIIGGGMAATYQVIQSTEATHQKVVIQEEADFLLRKLDWAMGSAMSATATPTSLIIGSLTFRIENGNMTLNSDPLNSSFVTVAQVGALPVFEVIGKKINIIFTVNGQRFDQTTYLH